MVLQNPTKMRDTQNLGWRAVLLLQFQPQFVLVIMISMYCAYMFTLMDLTIYFSIPLDEVAKDYSGIRTKILYFFDVIYLIDLISMIAYKNREWPQIQHLYEVRRGYMVMLDILSVLPIDGILYSLSSSNMHAIYGLRSRYILRIPRFLQSIRKLKNSVGVNHHLIELLQFLIFFSSLIVIASCIYQLCSCNEQCSNSDINTSILKTFYIISGKVTSKGYPVQVTNVYSLYYLFLFLNFFSCLYITGYAVGLFMLAMIQELKRKFLYDNIQAVVLKKCKTANIRDHLFNTAFRTFSTMYWQNRKGLRYEHFKARIMPEIMSIEISLDICWDPLKHSHVFRGQETHVLRYVAPFMQQTFLIPGELIFQRTELKSAMVYVATGIVQILSEQDGESPIVSFSSGTCLGESTLFINYPSSCSVISHGYCEIYILRRKDFLTFSRRYPAEFREMLKAINERYAEARRYKDLMRKVYRGDQQKFESLTLGWIKSTLSYLLMRRGEEEVKTLSVAERNRNEETEKLVFCCDYLDLLVMPEQIELVTDTVFRRTKCPCILQPDSFIVLTWNNITVIITIIYVFIYPYYAVFEPKTSKYYYFLSYVVTFFWLLDIYIIISTAIKTKVGIVTSVLKIITHHLRRPTFACDLIAAFPLELAVLAIARNMDNQLFILLQSPRLLKMYKFTVIFQSTLHINDPFSSLCLKYILYLMVFLYYTAAFFNLRVCQNYHCDPTDHFVQFMHAQSIDGIFGTMGIWLFLASQQITRVSLQLTNIQFDRMFVSTIVVQFLSCLFFIYFLASATATDALKKYDTLRLKEHTRNVTVVMHNMKINNKLRKQVARHLFGQIEFNDGNDILYTHKEWLEQFHEQLGIKLRRITILPFLLDCPVFKIMPENLIESKLNSFYIHFMIPGETISYAGEVCKEIQVLIDGFCKMHRSSTKEPPKIIGPGSYISVVELCLGIPVVNNIITLTHCKFIIIQYSDFNDLINTNSHILSEMREAINFTLQWTNLQPLITRKVIELNTEVCDFDKITSFKHFGFKLEPGTPNAIEYHSYFDRLGMLGGIRFLLGRSTIRSFGRFLKYWEIGRFVFAFITAIFCPLVVINTCINCVWFYTLLFLDITAWADILLRHHVCYFDTRGIEITHPLKTAVHYWTSSFIVDVLGVFPFEHVLATVFKCESISRPKTYLRMLRLLQTYRIFRGIWYVDKQITHARIWLMLKYIPINILVINTVGAFLINFECQFGSHIPASANFTAGVVCRNHTWMHQLNLVKPLSPWRVQLYGVYIAAVTIMGPGVGGFVVQNTTQALEVLFFSVLGYLFNIYISAKIVGANLIRNTDQRTYQEAMHTLVIFLSKKRMDGKLKQEIINHFELMWKKKSGKHLHAIIDRFPIALQEDILFDAYAKSMKESNIFTEASDSYFRSVVLKVEHKMFMKRAVIFRINTIHSRIFFIFKGQVEVLGADYNRLIVLPTGSMFGAIWSVGNIRQPLTIIAKGHVELLEIDNTEFFNILDKYQLLKVRYQHLIAFNTDYLLGGPAPVMEADNLLDKSHVSISSSVKIITSRVAFFNTIKNCNLLRVYQTMVLILVCNLGVHVQLYQMATQEHALYMILLMYILDILFIISIYLQFKTPYEDEFGVLVVDKKLIARHYIRNILRFPIELFSVIPLEIVALCFLKSNWFWNIWSYCRCNRFIRICLVIHFFQMRNAQLNIRVDVMRSLALLISIALLIQVATTILIGFSCFTPNFNVTPTITCEWDTLSSWQKLKVYVLHLSAILYVFTVSSVPDYIPNSCFTILYYVLMIMLWWFVSIFYVAEMSTTLDTILHSRMQYEEHIENIKEHMIRERTSPPLVKRVWLYVRLLWKQQKGSQFPTLLREAPYYLREAVLNSLYGYHLRKHPVFQDCHVDLIRQMAARLRTRTFYPGDNVVFKNDIDECMYFIEKGSVDALIRDDMQTEEIERTLYKNEMFGFQQGLCSNLGHEYTYRANRHTIILVLERRRWIFMLDYFPASKKLIFELE